MCSPGTAQIVRDQLEAEGASRVSRRSVLAGAAGAALAASFPASALANGRGRKQRYCDLTHTFREGFPVFVTGEEPERETIANYATDGFYAQKWTFGEHSGTHMDVPGHFIPGGRLSPDITVPELIVPVVVVDIRKKARQDPNAMVEVDDIKRFERKHGKIPRGALVAADSGWASKVDDPLAFKGGVAFPNYNFPGWGLEAALYVAEKRDVTAIGIDTLSLDPGNSATFPVHVQYLGTDRYGIENLTGLDCIPPSGATAYVGLIPWEEGSGGPCRVVASW
jgi:kynurenine formamidase